MPEFSNVFHENAARPPSWGLPDPETQREFYKDVIIKRLFAWLIDVIIIVTLCILVSLLTFGIGFFLWGLIYLVVGFVYRTMTLTSRSATIGMRVVAIEMRNHRGERFDRTTSALHSLIYLVSMSTFLLQIISIVMMFLTPRGQGLGDMLLGTAAVNRMADS